MKLLRFCLVLFGLSGCTYPGDSGQDASLIRSKTGIEFPAQVYPHRYNTHRDRAQGHHLLVWSGGGNAHKALLETDVHDALILESLLNLGATAGNNLTSETWNQRNNPDSPEPDQRVQGSHIKMTLVINEQEFELHELFLDQSTSDFDIRLGGHAELIPVWRSGCVTCLFSCPGGRSSNAAFTIRDQAMERKSFRANEQVLPDDGTTVTVRMSVVD